MTVHDTMIVRTLMRWAAQTIFFCSGWKAEGERPAADKCVVIAAPHTSNWDFLYTVCLAFIFRMSPRIMMKSDWFFWPMGPVLRWLGAIPVNRSKSNNVVAQSIEAFNHQAKLFLVVPPAGTPPQGHLLEKRILPHRQRRPGPHRPGFCRLRPKEGRVRPVGLSLR